MGHVGISVAVAGSSAVQMVLLVVGLRLRLGTVRAREIGASAARTLIASVVGAAGGWGAARLLADARAASALSRALPGLLGSIVFVALFSLAAWGVHSAELELLLGAVRRRTRGHAVVPVG